MGGKERKEGGMRQAGMGRKGSSANLFNLMVMPFSQRVGEGSRIIAVSS